jgi:hypothetical protein
VSSTRATAAPTSTFIAGTVATPTPTVDQASTVTTTPLPSPSPDPNTPPGTILTPGEPWKQDGVVVLLDRVRLEPRNTTGYVNCYRVTYDLRFGLAVRNESTDTIVFVVAEDSIVVASNLGRQFDVTCWDNQDAFSIEPGDEVVMNQVWFQGEIADQRVSEVIVTISFSRITEARWRIPIFH